MIAQMLPPAAQDSRNHGANAAQRVRPRASHDVLRVARLGVVKEPEKGESFRMADGQFASLVLPQQTPDEREPIIPLTSKHLVTFCAPSGRHYLAAEELPDLERAVMALDRHALDLWCVSIHEREVEPFVWRHENRWMGELSFVEGPREPSPYACKVLDERTPEAIRERAVAQIRTRNLGPTVWVLEGALRRTLGWWEAQLEQSQQQLPRDALVGFQHLACRVRTFGDLERALTDRQGAGRKLRVCNVSGLAVRAESSWVHPEIRERWPNKDKRARAGDHHLSAMIGLFPSSEPLSEHALAVRYIRPCASCGALFQWPSKKKALCPECGEGPGRTRRHRVPGKGTCA
jgi:hypothetical protein